MINKDTNSSDFSSTDIRKRLTAMTVEELKDFSVQLGQEILATSHFDNWSAASNPKANKTSVLNNLKPSSD